jgi:TPR repeat protein
MKTLRKIALLASFVAVICGAAVTWHFVGARIAERKLAENAKAYRIRAEQGDAKAQSGLASMCYHGKGVPRDYREALNWWRKAADHGDAKAQYGLGFMYYRGEGVAQEYTEAVDWFHKAANQGDARAQDSLGYAYAQGTGVPLDYAEAVAWYRKAADQGDAQAQDSVGFAYYQGKGVPQDYAEAVAWYRKAADQGDARAQDFLGYAYHEGKGVPQDYEEAALWYGKAAQQGDEHARLALRSRKIRFTTRSKINLSVFFLGSVLLLINSKGNIRDRQRRRTALAGLLGLSWIGLTVYGYSHFGMLQSLSAVNAFYFGKSLLSGIFVATLTSLVWPRGAKTMLRICGVMFIGFNIWAITHYDLRQLTPYIRAFYYANGLLIGVAIASTILWLEGQKARKTTNGGDGVTTGNGIEPLRT